MAIEECDQVISGPKPTFAVPKCSLADRLIPRLKAHPKNNIIEVNAENGEIKSSAELLALSLRIAEGLKKIGMGVNDVVALVSRNQSNTFAAALAAIWQGGTAAPIDPTMKPLELKHMFGLIKPKFIFCEQDAVRNVSSALQLLAGHTQIIIVDSTSPNDHINLEDMLCEVDVNNYRPQPVESPDTQLALIMPSSGTTGLPKGVGLTHTNILFQLAIWEASPRPYDQLICLQVSHFFWISGALALLLSTLTGMRRVFIENINDLNTLKAIHDHKPNWGIFAPSVLTSLLNNPAFKKFDVNSVKMIVTGGSALPKSTVERLPKEWSPDVKIFQVYGMTELAGVITNSDPETDIASVGKLSPGIVMKVMDTAEGKALGPRQVGEIYLKSVGIMKCYVGNENATKEVIDNSGWYHSGDLGFYDEEGKIYIVDRLKEMIKVKNMQVAPAEIETLIEAMAGVLDVGVVGIPHEKDMYRPLALVVKQNGVDVDEAAIVRHVKENLSDYKQLTGGVRFVHAIPRTPTGKIKRVQLKELAKSLY